MKQQVEYPRSAAQAYLFRGGPRLPSCRTFMLGFFVAGVLMAQQERITSLMSHALAEAPDKQLLMYTVEFPPGFSSPVHRHNAQVSVYVLDGSVTMQVKGGEAVTLTPGQSFYEGPDDIHAVSRNASSTKPAKVLVFLIGQKGAPLMVPAR